MEGRVYPWDGEKAVDEVIQRQFYTSHMFQ